jgi:hypothetical protein
MELGSGAMSPAARILAAAILAMLGGGATAADAPAAHPDFTGIWLPDAQRAAPWPARLPLTPAGRSFMDKFDAASQDPNSFCMPFGTPRNMLQTQFPLQIVQTPRRLTMVLQPDLSNAEVRRIPLDGSALPEEPDASWFGTSRGRWNGTTLVIETIGLRDDSLVSGEGLPHSEQLRVIEHLSVVIDPRRGKVLVDEMELRDPVVYTEPLRTRRYFVQAPQATLTEGSCVARKWIDKLWRDRLQEHAQAARPAGAAK